MDKDEIKGKVKQGKGYVKDKAGEAIGDKRLEAEGEIERGAGQVQEGFGQAKRKIDESLNDDE
jgi:uncharacterized protein YjbJ (UPF0337 family)